MNTRRKDNQSGEWVDKPNYFDVTIFGRQGENAAQYLSKGRPVAIDGRLDWSEWQDKDTGKKRQKVEIVADNVQFLGGREEPAPATAAVSASPRRPTCRRTRPTSRRHLPAVVAARRTTTSRSSRRRQGPWTHGRDRQVGIVEPSWPRRYCSNP